MKDSDCVQFLQWALPRLHMRWPGFRKVRAQVCKRLQRRIRQLDLDGIANYRQYLQQHPPEWRALDALSRVTISRFYRDKSMFAFLQSDVLPQLTQLVSARRGDRLRVLCVGASSGEEPYTMALIWHLNVQFQFPGLQLQIIATDADPAMIMRATSACYPYSSIKNLPANWRESAFDKHNDTYCLKSKYRRDVEFVAQDVRNELPGTTFDLILCRNLVFTYFDDALQREVLGRLYNALQPGGALIIGIHEDLPDDEEGFQPWSERLRVFRKDDGE